MLRAFAAAARNTQQQDPELPELRQELQSVEVGLSAPEVDEGGGEEPHALERLHGNSCTLLQPHGGANRANRARPIPTHRNAAVQLLGVCMNRSST